MHESVEQVLVQVVVFLVIALLVVIGRWIRKIHKQLDAVHDLAISVDSAVNHRPSGDPKLYDMVKAAGEQAMANGEASEELKVQFAEHSRNDEVNFADIRARLAHMPQTGNPASQA